MPRPYLNDYIIYKIINVNNDINLCYIGSTADFKQRKRSHSYNCRNESSNQYNRKVYKTIRENGGWSEFKMVEIKEIKQITKRHAEQVEEEYRIEMKADMNAKVCFVSEEQKAINIKESCNNYYENNKEKCNETNKVYYQNNKERCNELTKKWSENNAEKSKEIKQRWYDKNKHKKEEKIICECGFEGIKGHIARHRKSSNHIKLMEEKKSD